MKIENQVFFAYIGQNKFALAGSHGSDIYMEKKMKAIEELSLVLAEIEDSKLIAKFLKSILTPNEFEEISSRWALVRLLDQGVSQRNIAKKLGLSLCKITRGSHELKKRNSAFKQMIEQYKGFFDPEKPRIEKT